MHFSPVTPVGISHFLLAIPVPLTGSSVPEDFESEKVEDAIGTMRGLYCFLFLKVFSIDLEVLKNR